MPTGNLPDSGKKLFEEVYQKALKGSCKGDEECAARTAWSAVKGAGWSKDDEGNWHKKAILTEFSMRIEKAAYDKATNQRRWRMVASDTDEDLHSDEMSLELFNDFVARIARKEKPPEEYCSEFWAGGEPYVSVSHYPDLNGTAVPGITEATFVDGTYLKAKGLFLDNPLGRKCFEAVCEDMYGTKSVVPANKIRVSIAFLDFAHVHKSNGVYFERTEETPICMECVREFLSKERHGKIFKKGLLVHYALTRVPANERTTLEVEKMAEKSITRQMDAESIVGKEEAERLEEAISEVTKSTTELVTFSDVKEDEKKDEKKADGKEDKEEEKKSEAVVEPVVETVSPPDISEIVRSVVAEEIAKMAVPASEPKVEHALDPIYRSFREAYDEVIKMNVPAEERLRSLQEAFNDFGGKIIQSVKSIPEPTPQPPSPEDAMAVALSQAFAPLTAKLDALLNKFEAGQSPVPVTPNRRSLQPTPNFQPPVQMKSLTTPGGAMKISDVVNRTT